MAISCDLCGYEGDGDCSCDWEAQPLEADYPKREPLEAERCEGCKTPASCSAMGCVKKPPAPVKHEIGSLEWYVDQWASHPTQALELTPAEVRALRAVYRGALARQLPKAGLL